MNKNEREYKITINYTGQAPNLTMNQWGVSDEYKDRIAVENKKYVYSFVFDDQPYIEIWSKKNNEINLLIKKILIDTSPTFFFPKGNRENFKF
ncbi:MAG: hypothetical protein HC836_12540 [Richelia sp. RM2_1_2]|nr:hypothetical protein [Richelia sp. RM2_1_2]